MFEIRLDDELIISLNSWRETHTEVIDFLLGNDSPTLKKLCQHYTLYTGEDLFHELRDMTGKKITININFAVNVPVKANQHILEDQKGQI